jgi:serine/threonine-protein kinase
MVGHVFLGKYRVTRELDEGGLSRIFLAKQVDQPREVVVKVLKDSMCSVTRAVEHFRREIHITKAFHHPNSVACYDASTRDRDGPILVMEYLRGVDLNHLLQREKRLSPERAGRLLIQLCDVLQAAHDEGIVHRDIKPGNLMIQHPDTSQETVKLMDFGLAKMSAMLYISPEEVVDFTLPAASGTPEYISPEMVRSSDADASGDIYSVGVVLFEMLTGRRPFQNTRVEDLLQAHLEAAPPRIAQVAPQVRVPPSLEALIQSCLAKSPEDRPRSAWDLALAYQKALGRRLDLTRASKAPSSPAPSPSPCVEAARLNPSPRLAVLDRTAVRESIEANMPEAMAMLKLRGFIHDLNGEVVESVPGMIRVRLAHSAGETSGGVFGLFARKTLVTSTTDLELHMERRDPTQANRLTITLIMRSSNGLATAEWRTRCNQITRDFQAYLMGR